MRTLKPSTISTVVISRLTKEADKLFSYIIIYGEGKVVHHWPHFNDIMLLSNAGPAL